MKNDGEQDPMDEFVGKPTDIIAITIETAAIAGVIAVIIYAINREAAVLDTWPVIWIILFVFKVATAKN